MKGAAVNIMPTTETKMRLRERDAAYAKAYPKDASGAVRWRKFAGCFSKKSTFFNPTGAAR